MNVFIQSSFSKGDKYDIKINGCDHPALLISRRNIVQTFRQSTDGVHQSLGHAHLLDPDVRWVEEELGDSKSLVVHTNYLYKDNSNSTRHHWNGRGARGEQTSRSFPDYLHKENLNSKSYQRGGDYISQRALLKLNIC